MGLININTIGAFIITILLAGIIQKRPSPQKIEEKLNNLKLYSNIILTLLLLFLFYTFAFKSSYQFNLIYAPTILVSGLTIWIHEAGHIYWMWGGDTMHSFGGTFNEIIFPGIPFAYCLYKNHFSLAGLFIFWLGLNCFGISRYMGDARAQVLPLLGGDSLRHDWNNIFKNLDLLELDQEIAFIVKILAWCFSIMGLIIFTNFGKKLLTRTYQ